MVLDTLKEAGVILDGHFLLSSGLHSGRYCQCAKLFERPQLARQVVAEVAEALKGVDFDVIVGPAMGGIIAAYELSAQTGKPNCFAERADGQMTLRRGFAIPPGARALIMEDVITTGKSSMEVRRVIEEQGGAVVALACIVDRRAADEETSLPVYAAIKLSIPTYRPEDCPLCGSGIPAVKPGSRTAGDPASGHGAGDIAPGA